MLKYHITLKKCISGGAGKQAVKQLLILFLCLNFINFFYSCVAIFTHASTKLTKKCQDASRYSTAEKKLFHKNKLEETLEWPCTLNAFIAKQKLRNLDLFFAAGLEC